MFEEAIGRRAFPSLVRVVVPRNGTGNRAPIMSTSYAPTWASAASSVGAVAKTTIIKPLT